MKKLVAVSLIMAGMVLMGGLFAASQAQSPATDLKPTFISPTPGLYVNGWPPFTVSYPKEWEVQPPLFGQRFRVAAPRPGLAPSPELAVGVDAAFRPLSDAVTMWTYFLGPMGRDFNVLYDKPAKLLDGTPTQEACVEWTLANGPRLTSQLLIAKKGTAWISVVRTYEQGKVEDELGNLAFSLNLLPDQEKPVQVPDDIRAFLDRFTSDVVSHDLGKIMAHYSDKFLQSGFSKGIVGSFQSSTYGPILRGGGVTSSSATVTVFEPNGDKAFIDGFFTEKSKDDPTPVKIPMGCEQIIKENNQWKWYGNQK